VSEYALIGAKIAKYGTLIGGVSEAGFLIGLERNRSDYTFLLILALQAFNFAFFEIDYDEGLEKNNFINELRNRIHVIE